MLPALFALLIAAETPSQPVVAHEGHSEEATSKVEKKVCRTDDSNTGSRMRKKVCMTQTEWARKDQGKSTADLKTIGGR
jgi:hypothetical protein